MIAVLPTRPHSERIALIDSYCARIVTRPSWRDSSRSSAATIGPAKVNMTQTVATRITISVKDTFDITSSIRLSISEPTRRQLFFGVSVKPSRAQTYSGH